MGKINWGIVIVGIGLAAGAVGCSAEVETTRSTPCTRAFQDMAAAADEMYALEAEGDISTAEEWNAIEVPALNQCETAEEWLAAAKANPSAIGFTHEDAVDEMALYSRCVGAFAVGTPVCEDAQATGIMD